MDNQHKMIKGYRDLSAEEIALMNEVKELANMVGDVTDKIAQMPAGSIDKRWLAIGVTDLQKGFMGVVRSIAQPGSF